jgi:pimeloyl-ACP methyl ester carboxylesterase
MARVSALASLLLCVLIPASAMAAETVKTAEVNGVRLSYVEQGSGEPIVFVHGLVSDLRAWDPIKDEIAKKYHFVAYTQRYFGTTPWTDDGKQFSQATLANDLAKFIESLNVGPVHLVAWSYGGPVATNAALKNPSLVRSLILYEPALMSVLPEGSADGKTARDDRAKMMASAVAASKAGDPVMASRVLLESVWKLAPGEFNHEAPAAQTMVDENARTTPLAFAAPPPPDVTCDMLKNFNKPTLIMRGEKTYTAYVLISEQISRCVPGAKLAVLPNVNHDGPMRDPGAFSGAILGFLSNR